MVALEYTPHADPKQLERALVRCEKEIARMRRLLGRDRKLRKSRARIVMAKPRGD